MKFDNFYITSDLHFFHHNIVRYCKESRGKWIQKNSDGIPDILSMNEYILQQFDNLPSDCTIINNGDLYLNGSVKFDDIKPLVDRMKSNGKKLWLILGNHDRTVGRYMKDRRGKSAIEIYTEMGFDRIFEFPIVIDNYILSHEPMYISPNSNLKNIYGHTHDLPVDADYFNRECENWAMMERVKSEGVTKQTNLDIDTSVKDLGKTINPSMYSNVCWDYRKNIVKLEDVFKELKNK